jgi:Prealbumin-like fold domain
MNWQYASITAQKKTNRSFSKIRGDNKMKTKGKILLTGMLVLMLVVGSTGTALATLSGGSTFESGDGDLAPNTSTPPAAHDWNSPVEAITCPNTIPGTGTNCGLDLVKDQGDNALGQGSKEDNPVPTVVFGSIPPSKDDLSRFYVNKERIGGNDYLYLAWERSNLLGSAHMDFELSQDATLSTNGVTTVRTAGDLLIDFDFGGSGVPVLTKHTWITSGNPATDCEANNTLPCWDKAVNLGSFAEAAVNSAPVVDTNPPGAPRTLAGNTKNGINSTFGEAAINLTGSGIFPTNTCEHFGAATLKSRSSGNSFTSELKDFIAPIPVNITNCGVVNIHKQDDLGAPLSGAVFTLFTDNAPLDGAPPHGAEDVATNFTCTTDANGNCSIINVTFGNYWAAETTGVPNHDLAADQSFSLTQNTPNLTISLTFVDPRRTGAILVTKTRKHAADGPGDHPHAGVSITVNGVTKVTDANGQACFDGLQFGNYTVHESVPAGYHVDANDKSVTVDNAASCSDATYVGETVSFHNTPLTNITVSVDSQVPGGTSSTITCTPGGSAGPGDDIALTLSDQEPGTYTCTIVIDP